MLCPRPTFKLLMDGLVTARADLNVCRLEKKQLQLDLDACQARVAELIARPPCPVCAPPTQAHAGRFVAGYALGLLSVATMATALALPIPDGIRLGMGMGAVVGMGIGMVMVLP